MAARSFWKSPFSLFGFLGRCYGQSLMSDWWCLAPQGCPFAPGAGNAQDSRVSVVSPGGS